MFEAITATTRSWGLGRRILALTTLTVVLAVCLNYVVAVRAFRGSAEAAMFEKGAAFTAVADEAKALASTMHASGAIDSEKLLAEAKAQMDAGKDYSETKFFNTVPVVVGWTAAKEAAAEEGIEFRITAFNARNKKNSPESGSFRESMLRDLEKQVAAGGSTQLGRIDHGTNSYHYMRSIVLDESCMACHGDPKGKYDPDGDGKDPIGFAMEGWKPGASHGAYEVVVPLKPMDEAVTAFIVQGAMWTVPALIAALCCFSWALYRLFRRPMDEFITKIHTISKGDLRARADEAAVGELGSMAKHFNALLDRLETTFVEFREGSHQIDAGSGQVSGTSQALASASTEQAASLERINQSLAALTSRTEKSADGARHAVELTRSSEASATNCHGQMQDMSKAMNEMKQSSDAISKVLKVIDEIAFQTNLLALNAAVEAARAGEAGKGFAVVAEEVRNLAGRSAQAAKETATMVEESTSRAERAMALSDQVASSLERIVSGTKSVNELVAEFAQTSQAQAQEASEISQSVHELDKATQQNAGSAEELAAAAEETASQAGIFRDRIAQFQVRDE